MDETWPRKYIRAQTTACQGLGKSQPGRASPDRPLQPIINQFKATVIILPFFALMAGAGEARRQSFPLTN
jgi:hypothetical protein